MANTGKYTQILGEIINILKDKKCKMSSNIRINRICKQCGDTFVAKTFKTQFCSHNCNSSYLRVGTIYYKLIERPQISGDKITSLVKWSRETIIQDHGRSYTRIYSENL